MIRCQPAAPLPADQRHALPQLMDLPTIGHGPHPAPGRLDVDLWRYDHDAGIAPERMSALLALLSAEEHAQLAGLRDDSRRQRFVVGRALCRYVLSHYAPIAPHEWRFALGSRGKPFIAAPALSLPLWFNLSHTAGVSVCAVTGAGSDIGIDVERVAPGPGALEIAEQFFPEVEANALRLLPSAQRGEAFASNWALKESFVKARQISLADGICGTAFFAGPDDIDVTFFEPLHERAQDWQFKLLRLDPVRIIALAVHAQTAGPLSLRAGTCVEL